MVPFPTSPGSMLLPDGGRVEDVAARCRTAALEFTNGAEGWTKADLAAWLVGPYRAATRSGSVPPPPSSPSGTHRRSIEPAAVDDMLTDAHVRVLAVLENVAISRDKTTFAQRLAADNTLLRVTDRQGNAGWIPVAAPRMRLATRVLTLFAADALSRPGVYESLTVCHRCEHVRFRDIDRDCGCGARPRGHD
jgi:hypothetical protein